MATKKTRERSDIPEQSKWDLTGMYEDDKGWERELASIDDITQELLTFQGRLAESADTLLAALKKSDEAALRLSRLVCYAKMKQDEDNRVSRYQEMFGKAMAAAAKTTAASSFMTPELLASPEDKILGFIAEEPVLAEYEFNIRNIFREKKHVLSAKEEHIFAELGDVLGGADTIFSMLNDADLKFEPVGDRELTHGNYISYLEGENRDKRKQAFRNMYEAYKRHINTIGATYSNSVKYDCAAARMHNYSSARNAALFGDNIPESVYDNLITEIHEALPTLHRYLGLRKKALGLDELMMYDVYTPLAKVPCFEIPFDDAVDMIKKALAPMGSDYVDIVSRGIKERWVDVYENTGKTSGAYSFGTYDTNPYILLNFQGRLQDVLTLIHELGHSMHSYYTRHTQPQCTGDYSIFVAEVASTVNECLLLNYLLRKEKTPEMKKYLINRFIEEIRATIFRQTMFAEFEAWSHDYVEQGGCLTADILCKKYEELNALYFGDVVSRDEYIRYEWARIPHFYNAFYVYQYATGFSAAVALSRRILEGGPQAVADYKRFLTLGSSMYPVDELKIAGVDMTSKEPIKDALVLFRELVDELELLL